MKLKTAIPFRSLLRPLSFLAEMPGRGALLASRNTFELFKAALTKIGSGETTRESIYPALRIILDNPELRKSVSRYCNIYGCNDFTKPRNLRTTLKWYEEKSRLISKVEEAPDSDKVYCNRDFWQEQLDAHNAKWPVYKRMYWGRDTKETLEEIRDNIYRLEKLKEYDTPAQEPGQPFDNLLALHDWAVKEWGFIGTESAIKERFRINKTPLSKYRIDKHHKLKIPLSVLRKVFWREMKEKSTKKK